MQLLIGEHRVLQDEEAEEIDLEAELGVELGTGDDADYEGELC